MKKVLLLYILFIYNIAFAQFYSFPIDERYDNVMYRTLLEDTVIDVSWHPVIGDIKNNYPVNLQWKNSVLNYLTSQSNFEYHDNDYSIHLNLLGQLSFGNVRGDTTKYYRNTRGFEIYGNLGKKLFYYTKFLETQAVFVPYISEYIDSMVVIPGEGWWKRFGDNGRDYSYASGYILYKPLNNLFLELGHGKNFIGTGYRSLILSDNSFIYPYLKIRFSQGHFSFTNLWAEFYQFRTVYYYYHYPKHASYSSFSYFNQKLNMSFIIATIWKTSDYQTYVNRFPVAFFVPITSPLIYGLDSENNSLLALNVGYRIQPLVLYGQLVVDKLDLSKSLLNTSNRFGYQLGMRSYDILQDKFQNIHLGFLAEVNLVRPYMYSSEYEYQGFYHYNQPIAHPAGAGFREKIFQAQMIVLNFEFKYKYSSLTTLPFNDINNIFTTNAQDIDITIGGENATNIIHNTFMISILLNYNTGLKLYYGIDIRDIKSIANQRTFYKFVGLSTDIGRFYYDF